MMAIMVIMVVDDDGDGDGNTFSRVATQSLRA